MTRGMKNCLYLGRRHIIVKLKTRSLISSFYNWLINIIETSDFVYLPAGIV